MYIDHYSLFASIASREDMADYFNQEDIRRALQVTNTMCEEEWPSLSASFSHTKEYNACNCQDAIHFLDTTIVVDIYRQNPVSVEH